MKKLLLFNSLFLISIFSMGQDPCNFLFISEYVEGWQNNKAIELYNPTDQEIDLSNYRLDRYSNGSSSAAANQKLILEGIMPPLSVYVIVLDRRDPEGTGQDVPVWDELQAKADLFASPIFEENNSLNFNGNDAVVLTNIENGNNITWDMVGLPGQDPGLGGTGEGGWNDVGPDYTWIANGATGWTRDHSLIRKPDVVFGQFSVVDPWDVSVQWDSINAVVRNADGIVTGGNWASLGNHICDCGDVVTGISTVESVKFDIFPNPVLNRLTIESEVSVSRVEIYNMAGIRVLTESNLSGKKVQINTEEWDSGMYLVNLRFANDIVITKQIIKQ